MTSYDFDAVSRLDELVQNLSGTANDLTLGFTHNPAGQIAGNTRSNDGYSFTGLANGSVTDTHNGLNQVTATGATSVTHDARGNISAIGSSSYGYSSENLLTSGPSSVTLAYDPILRLYQTSGGAWRNFSGTFGPAPRFTLRPHGAEGRLSATRPPLKTAARNGLRSPYACRWRWRGGLRSW